MLALTLTTALLLTSVTAIPNITVIPLDNEGCYNWPGWIQSRPGSTGGLQFLIDSAEDSAVNELPAQSHTFNYASGWSDEHLVMTLRKSRMFAKEIFRCYDGRVAPVYKEGKLSVAKDVGNAFLTYSPGYEVQVYAHEIDGVRQPGVFLGAMNQTTWGFYYEQPEECGALDFYQTRLLGLPVDPDTEPKARVDPWFQGFLKVVEYY